MPKELQRTSVLIRKDTAERLDRLAERGHRTRSGEIRLALETWTKRKGGPK